MNALLRCMGKLAKVAATSVIAVAIALSAVKAQERAQSFSIAPQSLETALLAFSDQTDIVVTVPAVLVAGKEANAVDGTMTPLAALDRMLAGTGLRYAPSAGGGLTIVQAQSSAVSVNESVRLAQADPDEIETDTDDRADEDDRARLKRDEIVVTGTNITGLINNTAPNITLDRDYIDATGIGTTSGLIESLPQNFALVNQSGVNVPGVTSPGSQGSSINLRGVGEGTTLTLLNGRRIALGQTGSAVDISAFPLSAIERVEILPDGASAIYGSDAIGGVVNFVLRRDFDGAEIRLRAGLAEGGFNEYRASQAFGKSWGTGNALVSAEYYSRDLLSSSQRDFVPDAVDIGSLLPEDENHAVVFSGRQELTDALIVSADVLYTKRDSFNRGGQTALNQDFSTDSGQLTVITGLDWQIGDDWQIEASGTFSRNRLNQLQNDVRSPGGAQFFADILFRTWSAQIKADGTLFRLPGGDVRVAVGGDWRSETLDTFSAFDNGIINADNFFDQTVLAGFAEAYIPIVGEANAVPGLNRLELSLAGRFEDYDQFGSSFDPHIGIMWEPVAGLRFRGRYGTSFKAPKLTDFDLSFNSTIAVFFPDPGAGGISHILVVGGSDADNLSAQESESVSIGVEFAPEFLPGLQVELNYYAIDFDDRIAGPPGIIDLLSDSSIAEGLVFRDFTQQQVDDFIAIGELSGRPFRAFNLDFTPNLNFDPATLQVITDLRRRNISSLKTSGLDGSIQYSFDAAGGQISAGLDGTYILELEQQVTAGSAPRDTLDTFNNPPDLRLRGSLAWQHRIWSANVFVNYTDSYTDNRLATPVKISSHTTVDARISANLDEWFGIALFSDMTVAVSAQNLFDEDPPETAVLDLFRDMGFDPTNANPIGRFVAIELTKRW